MNTTRFAIADASVAALSLYLTSATTTTTTTSITTTTTKEAFDYYHY